MPKTAPLFMSNQEENNKMDSAAVKIQALWRGYASRKGAIQPCYLCGYPMTVSGVLNAPCSWCQARSPFQGEGRCDLCIGLCNCPPTELPPCRECGHVVCLCEPYIPCRVCGANCYGDDYEKWRFCSRRCMVRDGQD
jgi:hypothetical protein